MGAWVDFMSAENTDIQIIKMFSWKKTTLKMSKNSVKQLHHRTRFLEIVGTPSAAHSQGVWFIQFKDPSPTIPCIRVTRGRPGPDYKYCVFANSTIKRL